MLWYNGGTMGDWWENQWLRHHVTAAPFGILATTLLLTLYWEGWQWHGRSSWDLANAQVDLAAVVYAAVAVLAERGVRVMFWALDQRRQWREKWRAAAIAEGRAEGIELGRDEGIEVGRAEGRDEGIELGRAEGRDEGIELGRAEAIAEGIELGRDEGFQLGRDAMQQRFADWLAQVAQEKGIPLDDLLPPEPPTC